jgi:hypothetical protein
VTGVRFLRPLSLLLPGAIIAALSLCAQNSAPNPSSDTEPDSANREILANRYVHEVLPYWQNRLQLKDWTITILMSRRGDLRPGTLGNIHWDADKKSATIRVLDAADYPTPLTAALKDMEFTIVHELIHLELASLPRSEASRSDEEFAINHLTDALLQSGR